MFLNKNQRNEVDIQDQGHVQGQDRALGKEREGIQEVVARVRAKLCGFF